MRKSEKVRLAKMAEARRKVLTHNDVFKINMNSLYGTVGLGGKLLDNWHNKMMQERVNIIQSDKECCFPESVKDTLIMLAEFNNDEIIYEDHDSIFIRRKEI